jgi:hypothetical protein
MEIISYPGCVVSNCCMMKSKVLVLLKSVAVFNVIALRISVSAFQVLPVSNNRISDVQLFFKLTESRFDNASKKLITV